MAETRRGVIRRDTVSLPGGGTGSVLECTVCGCVFTVCWDAQGRLVNAEGEELAGRARRAPPVPLRPGAHAAPAFRVGRARSRADEFISSSPGRSFRRAPPRLRGEMIAPA